MTQWLGLACALVGDPRLLILDEPTSALTRPDGQRSSRWSPGRGAAAPLFSPATSWPTSSASPIMSASCAPGGCSTKGPPGNSSTPTCSHYLQPRWLLRIAGDVAPALAAIQAQPWATRAEHTGDGELRIDAVSLDAGERGIPAALASCGARQVSCEPLAADLESAFLALTKDKS
jgi:ABC-2 type transport system ATP-binding protein